MIVIPGIPIPAPRQTRSDRWKQRPCVLRYRAYRDEVRLRTKGKEIGRGGELSLTFYLPFPKSWKPTKRVMLSGLPHKQKPDCDNLIKAAMDSLFPEDCAIWSVQARKFWEDGEGPRTIIWEPLDRSGVK